MEKCNTHREDISEKLKAWNPMRDAYTNSQFNNYCTGPGADLDPELQPSELAKRENRRMTVGATPVPYLVLKNLPKEMTKNAVYNICNSHGKVAKVRDSNKNPHFFVDLASVADMEAVYRALEHNTYGFKVCIGQDFKNKMKEVQHNHVPDTSTPAPMRENIIDLENRKYMTSSKQHPRPHFEKKPIDDAHNLERAGLFGSTKELISNNKYKYQTGRAYIEMSESTKKFVAQKSQQSIGQFNGSGERYTNNTCAEKEAVQCRPCSQCMRVCDSICARCSQYFCGAECQRKAWPQHRYDCGKPEHVRRKKPTNEIRNQCPTTEDSSLSDQPIVDTKTSTLSATKSPLSTVMPHSGNLVSLTAVCKTNVVFLRSKTYEDNLLFFKTNSAIQADSKNLKPLRTLPKCGQIVVTRFNDVFSRAMILNVDNLNKIKLIHIDFGNLDIKLFDDLYVAPPYYCELPRLAIPVILKNVPDVFMTDEIRRFMYSYLDGIDLKLKYNESDFSEDRGVHVVELIDESTNQNFNNVIIALAKPTANASNNSIVLGHYLRHQLLPQGENVELVVMDNSLLCTGCISCSTAEYALEIQRFQNDLQDYANSLPQQNYAPRVDELCIAKYSVDGKWYRGRCLDLVGDGHPTIVFFDYGNISLVNVKDIRRYPSQFTFPIFTSDCEIEGLPECCNKDLVARLEQLIPNGSVLKCDSNDVYEEERFHVIKLKRIIQTLHEEGLLERSS